MNEGRHDTGEWFDNMTLMRIPSLIATPGTFRGRYLLLALLLGGLLAVGCHRKTPEESLAEATELLKGQDILSAEMKLEDLLKNNPTPEVEVTARKYLAICYIKDHEFDRGREELDKAIKLAGGPQSEVGFEALGMKLSSYLEEKKPEAALKLALETSDTLRTAPPELRQKIQFAVAQMYLVNKQEDKAREIYQRMLAQNPKNPQVEMGALQQIARIYEQKKESPKAIALYQDYVSRHPDSPIRAEALRHIGAMQKQLGQAAESSKSYDASEAEINKQLAKMAKADDKAQGMLELADVQYERGNVAETSKTLSLLLSKYPVSRYRPIARVHTAELELINKRPDKAIAILQEVVRENPNTQPAAQAQQFIQKIQVMMAQPETSGTLKGTAPTTGTLPRRPGASRAFPNANPRAGRPAPKAAQP